MKTDFPFTAIHQLLLLFSDSGVSIFRTYLFFVCFPYARGPKNQDFIAFLFFSNKAGVDVAEWLYRIRRRRS